MKARSDAKSFDAVKRVAAVLGLASICLLPQLASHADEEGDPEAAPPGEIRFVGKNLVATANGIFHRWKITRLEVDPEEPSRGVVDVEIDIASLDTGIGRRDEHLRSSDFFDVATYPTARVRVHDVRALEAGEEGEARYAARFDLRIRDVEQSLTGEFEVLSVAPPRVKGSLTLDRVHFGVGEAPGRFNPFAVKAEISIDFEAELAR